MTFPDMDNMRMETDVRGAFEWIKMRSKYDCDENPS
jgi:hypothetical protein